jgi:hypothetical protein
MAKASPSLSTVETASNPAIAAAAAEIHVLINSKPQSPTVDELAGVIAANLMTAAPASPALRRWQDTPEGAEWRALEAKLSRRIETVADISDDDAAYIAAEAEIHAEQDRLAAYVQHIWAMRPKNADDAVLQVLTRSAIVEHYSEQTDGFDGTRLTLDYLNPAELARNGRPAVCDDSAIAHLLDAVRQLEDLWTAAIPDVCPTLTISQTGVPTSPTGTAS